MKTIDIVEAGIMLATTDLSHPRLVFIHVFS